MSSSKPGLGQEPVHRLIDLAVGGRLDIPEFQREFVWTRNQVSDLLDSLPKGYPIGSILIWDLTDYTQCKHLYEDKPKEWIVDGQQRIVALCILSMIRPYWFDTDEWNNLLTKYRIKVNMLNLDITLEHPAYVYLETQNPGYVYLEKFAQESAEKINRTRLFTKIYDNANRVRNVMEIDVPVVKVS